MQLIFLLLNTLHLLAANVAGAGPLYSAWLGRRAARGDDEARRVGIKMAQLSLIALLLVVATGGLQLLGPDRPVVLTAAEKFPARDLLIAGGEIAFSVAMTGLLLFAWRGGRFRQWLGWSAASLTASNLLYHFPPLMLVLGRLARDPQWTLEPVLNRDVFRGLMLRPEIASLAVHIVLASVAVAGVATVWLDARSHAASAGSADEPERSPIGKIAAVVALAVTLVQFPVGLWVLISMPTETFESLVGGSPLHALAFGGGLLAALLLAQRLLAYALDRPSLTAARGISAITVTCVLLMTYSLGAL